ncbi:histidine phosphatase superfamily [Baffinella frigidus]|nr:histidine phosphatase superfamily [Cryptophyta sp. CCMP2293]
MTNETDAAALLGRPGIFSGNMRRFRAISALVAVIFSCQVQCSGGDPPDPRQSEEHAVLSHLGSKSGYTPPGAAEGDLGAVIPESCEAVMIAGVMRHGSRNPGKKDIAAFDLLEAKFRALSPSTLPPSFRWLPSFRNPYTVREIHELVPAGVGELAGIGARLRGRFPALFDRYRPSRHKFRATCKERAARSATAFGLGLFAGAGPAATGGFEAVHVTSPSRDVPDSLLRFFDHCPAYVEMEQSELGRRERELYAGGAELAAAAERVGRALFGSGPGREVSVGEATAVYHFCAFERAHSGGNASNAHSLCHALSLEDALAFEYADDLKHWHKKSYGMAINARMACPLLRHLLSALQARAAGASDAQAELLFAHGETLLPLLSLLGLFKVLLPTPSPHSGLQRDFRWIIHRFSVILSVGTPQCPYGIAYRRVVCRIA